MATYAIDAVRIDPNNGRVSHVRWGLVNVQKNQWANGTGPTEAPVIDVVDRITGGDTVWTVITKAGGTVLGPKVEIVVYPGGTEGIQAEQAPGAPAEPVEDLPRF